MEAKEQMRNERITAEEYRRRMLYAVREKEWMARVIRVLKTNGWVVYHTYRSTRSAPGFPDIVAVHPDRAVLLFAEIKTMKGKLTGPQKMWLSLLRRVADATDLVHVAVWRPDDYTDVLRFAGGREPLL